MYFKKIVAVLCVVSFICPQSFAGEQGDKIRWATEQSHKNAKLMAEGLLLSRLSQSVSQILIKGDKHRIIDEEVMLAMQQKINEVGAEFLKYAEDSEPAASDKALVVYNNFYNLMFDYINQKNLIRQDAKQTVDYLSLTAKRMIDVCDTGLSAAEFVPQVVSSRTPVPEIKVNIKVPVYGDGSSPGIVLNGTVATGNADWDGPGIAGTVTTAGALQFGLTKSIAAAFGLGAGVTLLYLAIEYFVALDKAVKEAADISEASVNHFMNKAEADDVAKYFRDQCLPVKIAMEDYLETSAKILSGDQNEVLKVVEESKLSLHKINMAKSTNTKLEAHDVKLLIKPLMYSLLLKNQETLERIRRANIDSLFILKRQAKDKLTRILYSGYFAGISKKYSLAMHALKEDLSAAREVENVRMSSDVLLATIISDIIAGRPVKENKKKFIEFILKARNSFSNIRSANAQEVLKNYFRSLEDTLGAL